MADGRENCTRVAFRGIWDTFTKYDTVRSVRFHSPIVGLCNRLIQGAVIAYVIIVVFLRDKEYQLEEEGESSVVVTAFGLQRNLLKNLSSDDATDVERLTLIWDSADVITPSLENNALFVITKVSAAPRQQQGICPEDKNVGANCKTDADCELGRSVHLGHGYVNGACNVTTGTCDVHAWCPLENKAPKKAIKLHGGQNLTIIVKNFIMFPKQRIRRRNIGELDENYVASCYYHVDTDPHCPAFKLGYIIEEAKEDYEQMAEHGAVLSFAIQWNCNLDYHIQHCMPTYTFRRLDVGNDGTFPGWNYRRTGYWEDNGQHYRYLMKCYGIRIVFNVYAVAGKFNFVRFTMNLGSGLGLLGTATLICDFILFHCARRKTTEFRSQAATLHMGKSTMKE